MSDSAVLYITFRQYYELKFGSPEDYKFKEEVPLGIMKLVHNNLGLEFRTVVYPAGMVDRVNEYRRGR